MLLSIRRLFGVKSESAEEIWTRTLEIIQRGREKKEGGSGEFEEERKEELGIHWGGGGWGVKG